MPALDFPNSPAVDDLYGSDGIIWRWDGARWALTSSGGGGGDGGSGFTFVQDTAPTPTAEGDTWFNDSDGASGGLSYVAVDNGSGTLVWVQFAPGASSGPWVESDTYTPTIVSGISGGGDNGVTTNIAKYTFTGGPNVGDKGSLAITHEVVVSGASVSGPPVFALPPGFAYDIVANSGSYRLGLASLVSSSLGAVQWNSGNTFAYTAVSASGSYLAPAAISATVPATWAAGSIIRASFVIPQVVRV